MIIKCAKCKVVESLEQEEIAHIVNIAKTYNEDVSPNDYTAILSIIKGKCTDGKKHLYIYDETFSKTVASLIEKHGELCKNCTNKENELSETLKKIEELKNEIKNLDKKRDDIIKEVSVINAVVDGVIVEFEKATGTCDVKMWS